MVDKTYLFTCQFNEKVQFYSTFGSIRQYPTICTPLWCCWDEYSTKALIAGTTEQLPDRLSDVHAGVQMLMIMQTVFGVRVQPSLDSDPVAEEAK
ncbi:unnamed protein product [Protopolystoma xenopodis]|uniref:Uncharacterized protein n=1 Tax=Protopolystoma xenopodis TaxID=117903 RepID=A0A3S5A8X4_9PLAT|nr:unnamed protein product [Protopolystoma xenopodis]